MSIEINNIAALRVYSEATFGTDATSSPGLGSFTYVPFREGTATAELMTTSLPAMSSQQKLDGYPEEVLGARSAKLTFTLNLAPTGVAANTGTAQVTGALGVLLKASMGGESKNNGSTVVTGTDADTFSVTTGHGSRFAAGCAVGWVNASGFLEVREVESIATDTIQLKYAFSGTPSTGNAIYRSATYYLAENPTESLQFLLEGAESDDRWLLLGGQLTSAAITIDPTGAALPSIQFTYEFVDYKESDETAGSVTGTLSSASYTNYAPIVGWAGALLVPTVGQATNVSSHKIMASAIAFNPKIVFTRVTSPSAPVYATSSPVKQWRRTRTAPVIEGSWTDPFQGLTWFQARDALTDKAVWYQAGVVAGSSFMLSAPCVQIVNPQRVADKATIAAQTVSWKGRLDTDAGSATELGLSAFRIHLI